MPTGMRSEKQKKQVNLGVKLDSRLKDYSLAAAGVGALALAAPAHATIASTSPNLSIPVNAAPTLLPVPGYPSAIAMVNAEGLIGGPRSALKGKLQGKLKGKAKGKAKARSNVRPEVTIGENYVAIFSASSSASFYGKSSVSSELTPAPVGATVPTGLVAYSSGDYLAYASSDSYNVQFAGSGNYIGFSINGTNTHYGWVKLSISATVPFAVTVNQIAIEQCANIPITVGAASGGANCTAPPPTTPAPNSLWLMSLGIAGMAGLEALRRLRKAA